MAGYSFYHISMRSQISSGQPFAPFVPSQFNRHDPPQGYVTKKKIVPVTSSPYHNSDDDDEDELKHQRQTSPPRGPPSNAYGDYNRSTINKPDGYNNGISYGKKEGTKPSPVGAIMNDNRDGYNNGYGARKPTESSTFMPNNKYDGYGGYKNPTMKDHYSAYGSPVKKDDYDAYGNPVKDDYDTYGNSVKKDNFDAYSGSGSPAKKDNYEGYSGYKEGPTSKPKPGSRPIYNNGYGGYGHDKPFGRAISPIGDHSGNKDNGNSYYNNKPTPGALPSKGSTKLSKPTNDIDVALGFLEEEAANRGYNGGHKQVEYESDKNPHQRIYDGPAPLPRWPVQVDKKDMDMVNETERLKRINVKDNRPRSNFSDGISSNSGVINHIEAEKRFNGMRI